MSVVDPTIDELLAVTDENRFLLCEMAARRARDINDMMRGQRDRAAAQSLSVQVARATDKKPLSLAFAEIADGDVSYDPATIDLKAN